MTEQVKLSRVQRFQKFATNPLTILMCLLSGACLGWVAPEFSKSLAVVGDVYVDLLKMIVLPFMMSALIFGLQKLYRDGGTGELLLRLFVVFAVFAVVAAIVAALIAWLIEPGANLPASVKTALGNIVGSEADKSNLNMALRAVDPPAAALSLYAVFTSLIPTNIFAAMVSGEMLKALMFALIFGFAIGHVPAKLSDGFGQSLEAVYHACQQLTRWFNIPMPVVLISMSASQIAETGFEPLRAMLSFVIVFMMASVLLLVISVMVIRSRSGKSYPLVLDAMRETFSLGVATNNAVTCVPAMIDGLVDRLNFARSRVELLVPLTVSLLKAGAIAYFACGTIFIAELYGRELTSIELGTVVVVSVLSGFASTGMAGIMTIALMGTTCKYLGLPFEAAFVLFVAVDPLCAMVRTSVTVISGCAAIAMLCPKPARASVSGLRSSNATSPVSITAL